MDYALKAYAKYKASHDDGERYSHFLTFIVSYCRPFTASHGLGSLQVELPDHPQELDLVEGSIRHQRMMDLRNKFLGHSSLEGTKVVVLAPGATDPGTQTVATSYRWNIARREFSDERYAAWLEELVRAFALKLDEMIDALVTEVGKLNLDPAEVRYLDTPADNFEWTNPM